MINQDYKNLLRGSEDTGRALQRIYKLVSVPIVPLFILFLALESTLDYTIDTTQKIVMIYTLAMLTIYYFLVKVELFKANFMFAHYTFLLGVIIIVLVRYHYGGGEKDAPSLILASALIGICVIHPRATVVFYTITLAGLIALGLLENNFSLNHTVMIAIAGIIISVYSYWRHNIQQHLQESGTTFKGIFDSSNHQVYVLSSELMILDVSTAAAKYLKEKGAKDYLNKIFPDVFIAETDQCIINFKNAIEDCLDQGKASFNANCAIIGTNDFVPKEFSIRKGSYFTEEVFILTVRIVKEEKLIERELIAHKDNVTQILENINYFVFNISFDSSERFKHHVNFVSSKVEEVYGYDVDEYITLVKAERIDKDRHPEDKERINENFNVLLESGGKNTWRFRMKVKGEWRWMEEKMFVQKSPDGMTSLFGMVKDVSSEIQADKELIESEKRYRQIFETNLAGVYKIHVNGEILDCNPAFAKILGFDSIDEVKKHKIEDLYFDKTDRTSYLDELQAKNELTNYTSVLRRKDGKKLIINNNVSLLYDEGQPTTIVGTVVDVTDLHDTSLALQESEEKYRLLFEESNNAKLLLRLTAKEYVVADSNLMGAELFGRADKEVVGLKIDAIVDPSVELKEEMKEIVKKFDSNEVIDKEWEFIKSDGTKFYAEASFSSVLLNEENVIQLVIKDIADRKQYEKEILESRLSFKNIVDRSPASILIFSNNELAYVNPSGEDLFLNVLNSKDRNLFSVFPADKHQLIRDLMREAENDLNSYTEIELGEGDAVKKYSINVVNTVYNFEKANLFLLQDITLQTEYNIQKLRAEMAEETNISLQEEIKRHKTTQLSLIESTTRLKALFESAGHLYIASIDQEFNLVSYNKNFQKMVKEFLGKEVEVGVNFLGLFPIEEQAEEIIRDRFNSVLAGTPSTLISSFQSIKGEVWMESFMSPIELEGEGANEISFIAHNITEQIENRRQILVGEESNRALLLAVPDILFKATKEGFFTDYRPTNESDKKAFRKFLKTDEIKGKRIRDVLVDENVAAEIEEHILVALKTDELVNHNFSILFGDGGASQKVHYENRYSKINDQEVMIISRNVTSTVEYEEKLIESVKEKEVLLKEVHHRVKNNLQVINSILNLQSSYVEDDKTLQIIIESQNRIRSMSYIHESLYQTKDFSSINFQNYIINLIQNLVQSYEVYSDKTELDLQVAEVELALDQAIPCGLILNELITNALKYAYPDKEGGKITIEVFEKSGKVTIRVLDFGVGLPKGFKIGETDSLGLSLVDTLIDQIDGELKLKTDSGTEFLIIFEKQEI